MGSLDLTLSTNYYWQDDYYTSIFNTDAVKAYIVRSGESGLDSIARTTAGRF